MRITIRHQDPMKFRCINRPKSVAPDRYEETFCDSYWQSGNLIYLMRGGYVWRCIDASDLMKVS